MKVLKVWKLYEELRILWPYLPILRYMGCCGLNHVPHNSYVEALTPYVTIFGDRTYKEVIKAK